MKHSKRYLAAEKLVDRLKLYTVEEAVALVKTFPKTKFEETVDVAVRLGVDPRQADQNLRGTVDLPHGTGKSARVIAFAQGDQARLALEAGAIQAGGEELVTRITEGWLDFDAAVATPDMMPLISRTLGRVLGPRGLMPNPRTGTIAADIAPLVRAIQGGRIEYRVERSGAGIHAPIGKVSFTDEQLADNLRAVVETLIRVRPSTAKGRYLRSIAIAPTMGPGIHLDTAQFG